MEGKSGHAMLALDATMLALRRLAFSAYVLYIMTVAISICRGMTGLGDALLGWLLASTACWLVMWSLSGRKATVPEQW